MAPVSKGSGLSVLGDLASPPYRTQRWISQCCGIQAVSWFPASGCFLLLAHISRSRCLVLSRGRALLAFAPTIFSIPLPPAVPCVYPAVPAARAQGVRRSVHPTPRGFRCGVGVLKHALFEQVKHSLIRGPKNARRSGGLNPPGRTQTRSRWACESCQGRAGRPLPGWRIAKTVSSGQASPCGP